MARSRENAEWQRHSQLMALIMNRVNFDKNPTAVYPLDLYRPLGYAPKKPSVPKTAKDRMSEFFARNKHMPLKRLVANPDGTWSQVDVLPEA